MLPLQARVDLGVIAVKEYSTFYKSPRLEPCHQMVQCQIQDTHWEGGVLPSHCRDALHVFYSPSQLGSLLREKILFESGIKFTIFQYFVMLFIKQNGIHITFLEKELKNNFPGKGVAASPTPWCSRYWKGSLLFALDYSCQLDLL